MGTQTVWQLQGWGWMEVDRIHGENKWCWGEKLTNIIFTDLIVDTNAE